MNIIDAVVTPSGDLYRAILRFPTRIGIVNFYRGIDLGPDDAPEVRLLGGGRRCDRAYKPWPISEAELAEKLAA